MTESSDQTNTSRPFILSILCVAIYVYAGFLAILFLLALLFNTWVTSTLDDFFPDTSLSSNSIFFMSALGFILNTVSVMGAYFLWKLRKIGFYLYLLSNLIFILIPFLIGYGNYYSAIILTLIILIIALFLKKLK